MLEKLGVGPRAWYRIISLWSVTPPTISKARKVIGPKNAAAILGFYGSLNATYEAIDAGSASRLKPAQLAALEELRPRLEGVRALVEMRIDVPLDIGAVLKPRVPKATEDVYGSGRHRNGANG